MTNVFIEIHPLPINYIKKNTDIFSWPKKHIDRGTPFGQTILYREGHMKYNWPRDKLVLEILVLWNKCSEFLRIASSDNRSKL